MPGNNEKRQEATVRDFLNVIFMRKYMILTIVMFTSVSMFYFNARRPQIYSSSSRIMVKRGERSNYLTGQVRYLPWQEEMSSQIQAILSQDVFARASELVADTLAARGITRPITFSGGSVRAKVVGESNVFSISYASTDPVECQIGCDAVTLAYSEYYQRRTAPPEDISNFFGEEVVEVSAELEFWRQKKNDYLNSQSYYGVSNQGHFHMSKLTTLEIQASNLETKLFEQKTRVGALSELIGLTTEEVEDRLAFSMSRDMMTFVTGIKFTLRRLRLHREGLISKYTERHPEVVAVDTQIADLLVDLKLEVENSYSIEKEELGNLQSEANMIAGQITSARKALSELPDKELEIGRIESKITSLTRKHDLLLARQSEAEITLATTPQWTVSLLAPASTPRQQNTQDYVRLALGPFLSLIVGVGLAFFLESLDHSIKNIGEVEEYLSTKVLASITDASVKG